MANSFCKRQDQQIWLSCRPFLLSHLLAKVNYLPLNSSILKDKTHVFNRRDLTTPRRQGSSSPPFGKNDSQMPECCLGGGMLKPRFDWRFILGWTLSCMHWFSLSSRCVLVNNDGLWNETSWLHQHLTHGSHWGTIRSDWSDGSFGTTRLPCNVGSSGGCYLDHCLDHS